MKLLSNLFFCAALCAVSCRSEPLPSPSTNAIVSFNYPTGTSAVGWKVDSLAPAFTNNWLTATNWQPVANGPLLAGVTSYATTNYIAPGNLVTAWATNSAGLSSPPATPVTYSPDPIKFTAPTLSTQ